MNKKRFLFCLMIAILLTIPVSFNKIISTVNAESKTSISKKKTTLYVGETLTLKIKGTRKKVKWSSNKKSVATVSSKGKVKAKKKGVATITAKVGNKKYKCNVTVKSKKKKEIPVSTIILNETNKTVVMGSQFTLSATIVPINATNNNIIWQSINSNVATVSNGIVKAVGIGTTQIFASSDNGVSTSCTVTVTRDYINEFNMLNIYEKAGLYAISRIDKKMKKESKTYYLYNDGSIGLLQYRNSVISEYQIIGESAVMISYMPSDFSGGIVPNFIVYITNENKLCPYGMIDDMFTERWESVTDLGSYNTHTANELYEIFVGLQQSGYNVEQLCSN